MTTVVTGASGHLGDNLVRELIRRGHSVRAVYLGHRGALADLECESVRADIRDSAAMTRVLAGADTLYHLAAIISIDGDPSGAVRATNVAGVRNVMRCALAAGVRRVVHCSSIHAFDLTAQDRTLDEHSPRSQPGRQGAYDVSKADGEVEVRKLVADGLDAVIVNPTGVIGPRDPRPSRMGRVFLQLARRQMPALVRGGFNWVDVRDVVAGAIAAAEKGRTGENYLLSGHWASVRELADITESVLGVRAPRVEIPLSVVQPVAALATWYGRWRGQEPLFTREALAALAANRYISCDKARRELDFRPRPLTETVADLYDWFQRAGILERSR